MSLAGGSPVKVVDGVVLSNSDVVDGGVYFMERFGSSGARNSGTARLQFFDFVTRRLTTITPDLGRVGFGLSVSPDGRSVYFSRTDSSVEELMVVNNFR